MAGLEVRDLRFSYPGRPVLEGLSLSLTAGEFAGFLGPNGSGKSTFLKALLGFLKPGGGKVVFYNKEPADEVSPKALCRLAAFVPQNPRVNGSFSAGELALMGRLPHLANRWAGYSREDRRKAEAAMRSLGIGGLAGRKADSLSGGELQKVILARCLAQEGDIFLLDEATSNLDLNHSIEIMEILREKTAAEGKIVLAVLHDINLASQYCDKIYLLKEGRLRYQGSPAEVLTEAAVEDIYGIKAAVRKDESGRPYILPQRRT
ncbi:MAG: ABC transporter ATP-binding protein [Treponema sp.]|jgi:iron complex transport system ATP-binding protein|nr:ABC transporter ATP-binding protein [Treponema sp.]